MKENLINLGKNVVNLEKRSVFPKFSIIIPVYNVSAFLEDCLNSIIQQTYNNFEIICINDGSTDNSLEILEKFAQKDKRIKIFTQKNQGVSVARNLGLDKAKGEYILFCDADDIFKSNLCFEVAAKIEQTHDDVIAYGHENYIDNILDEVCYSSITKLLKKETLKEWLNLQVFVWEKAFKRSFIEEKNIRFPVGIKNAEDLVFCLRVYFSGAKYSLIEKALYEYQKERNGKSTFTNPDGIKNDTAAYVYFCQTDLFKSLSKKEQREVTNFFICGSISYLKKLRNTEHRERVIADLKNLSNLVSKNYSIFQRLKMKNYLRIQRYLFKEKNGD